MLVKDLSAKIEWILDQIFLFGVCFRIQGCVVYLLVSLCAN